MATTSWIAGSGDWNTVSDWSDGVPTPADMAIFTSNPPGRGSYTVTGGGTVAGLNVALSADGSLPVLAGTYDAGSFLLESATLELADAAMLSFASGTISSAKLQIDPGASLGNGPLTLNQAILAGTANGLAGTSATAPSLGTLPNAITLAGSATFDGNVTVAGALTGPGLLTVPAGTVRLGAATSLPGGLQIDPFPDYLTFGPAASVELAGVVGPVLLGTGTLTLDPGATTGTITAAIRFGGAALTLADQSAAVFAGPYPLVVANGSGRSTVVGAIDPGTNPYDEGPATFGTLTVTGGTGSVTVFGGSESGGFQGGSAGHNLLVGGADLAPYAGGHVQTPGQTSGYEDPPAPVTLVGGGDGDLLVSAGTDNGAPNVLIAGAGAETLTGSGSTARAFFFDGTGADILALGSGYSVVTAGSGAETISGGAGTAAIFAGGGADLILGGTGADYVQAGTGNATLFAGAGADLVGAVRGQSGGSLVLSGFRVGTDRLDLQGYGSGRSGIADSQVAGGSTALTLVDGTRITLLGVTNLGAGSFV